ncbi:MULTISPECIES: ribonuclease HI [Thermoactinomyces]|uniref:Ribonuclease H n=1 Tax=Thermoactinomyces vulgaris TaxID=2026 RepID=A0ABS0QJ32_THEVU|nr:MULTISPECIES: ribonuclease HI [Thermoactinomyces]KFZ40955.1 RNase H [Thermoactinomyces sp. Gus2-1]KYQ87294.1 ribonuclease HI [Thermoactinomyces sp. AS95]MBA4552034.1 ribonuclease HI [Thermoactinomyces vulgaris]MBA4597476.1 ribonuclease HI [Thermoactinomyces vulgaris]MBH8584105.1 ribonuclease HI [Thermoactinomyces sp. CICC 10735]
MKEVIVYTDGACSHNPGPGGWAAVLMYKEHHKEISGGEEVTTNNRMELTAVIEALSRLKEPCRVKVHSDSAYIVNCMQQKWYEKWAKNGWMTSGKKPVENQDLWKKLLALMEKHDVEFVKVKGHSNVTWNNRCDELARAAVPK